MSDSIVQFIDRETNENIYPEIKASQQLLDSTLGYNSINSIVGAVSNCLEQIKDVPYLKKDVSYLKTDVTQTIERITETSANVIDCSARLKILEQNGGKVTGAVVKDTNDVISFDGHALCGVYFNNESSLNVINAGKMYIIAAGTSTYDLINGSAGTLDTIISTISSKILALDTSLKMLDSSLKKANII